MESTCGIPMPGPGLHAPGTLQRRGIPSAVLCEQDHYATRPGRSSRRTRRLPRHPAPAAYFHYRNPATAIRTGKAALKLPGTGGQPRCREQGTEPVPEVDERCNRRAVENRVGLQIRPQINRTGGPALGQATGPQRNQHPGSHEPVHDAPGRKGSIAAGMAANRAPQRPGRRHPPGKGHNPTKTDRRLKTDAERQDDEQGINCTDNAPTAPDGCVANNPGPPAGRVGTHSGPGHRPRQRDADPAHRRTKEGRPRHGLRLR